MLKRKFYDYLLAWKKSKKNECLLVKGARQIGKTFIIDKFGRENYQSYIYINFIEEPKFKDIFEGSLSADEIYKKMSVYILGVKFIPNDTLIFLDEIQDCPKARTALKFLAIDGKYDVIASGSLLGINYKEVPSIPVGYERQVKMYSLDFEEYLWAVGMNDEAICYLKEMFDKKEKLPTELNNRMFEYLREYMVVGGMPDVVNVFLETNNFNEVQLAQEKIINSYHEDMIKYAPVAEKPKVRKCYDSIPKQLAKENKKFQYSVVEKNSTARKFGNSLDWLLGADVIYKCVNVNSPVFPLKAYSCDDYFKIYVNDIGLLVAMYGFEMKQAIISNTLKGPAKGGIYENLIADMLVKNGYDLHYFKVNDAQELEFLIPYKDQVVPIEVKAGNAATVSLNHFIDEFKPKVAYKFITGNVGVVDSKVTMPLYMAMFLKRE
jgi:hypothetical protein